MTRLATRFTARFGLDHPIVSAPMAGASGGALAAAVSAAGGLGLIGGGYADPSFIATAFRDAGNARVGCGFITWALEKALAPAPSLLDDVLARNPAALMLSFGDPARFAGAIHAAGVPLVCQCQSLDHVRAALASGASVIVAQGGEAGGHGASRATLTLVPETADLLARESPDTLLLAAGGIADGRGLAAALMLGADGVLVGTRFWASGEALSHERLRARALALSGDDTLKTVVVDLVRRLDWPEGFSLRAGRNRFLERWHGRDADLTASIDDAAPRFQAAVAAGDPEDAALVVGEAIGLIADTPPAAEIITRMVGEAAALLSRRGPAMVTEAG